MMDMVRQEPTHGRMKRVLLLHLSSSENTHDEIINVERD